MQKAAAVTALFIKIAYGLLIVLPGVLLFLFLAAVSPSQLDEPLFSILFTLPALVGVAIGALTYKWRPTDTPIIVVGSFVFLSGAGASLILIGALWLPFGVLILAAGLAKFWCLRVWPSLTQAVESLVQQ